MRVSTVKTILDCKNRQQLAELLDVKLSVLTYFAYGNGKKYTTFTIPKKSGGPRIIKAPVGPLRSIQRRLAHELNEIYKPPPFVQGFVQGGSIVGNASLHLGKKSVLNIDLSDFFPSITANRVIGLLRSKPFNFGNELASTIAGLACYEGSLPQGAPTSPILSNMICLRLDNQLCNLSRRAKATYSRYADDITISTTLKNLPKGIVEKVEGDGRVSLGSELVELVRSNYFEINDNKTRLSAGNRPKFVTGIKVNINPNLTRRYIRQLRSMLHAWATFGPEKAQQDFSTKYGGGSRSFQRVIRGKLAYLKAVKGEHDLRYRKLYNRYVELEGKGKSVLSLTPYEKLFSQIYLIKSKDGFGTGFILDGAWLITCDHVVAEGAEYIEYFNHNESVDGQRKYAYLNNGWRSPVEKFDLIALRVDGDKDGIGKSFKSAPVGLEVAIGTECRIIGYPGYPSASQPRYVEAKVSGIEREAHGVLNAYVDKLLIGGCSGGPVLNEHSQVIGMVQRGATNWKSGDEKKGPSFIPIQEIRRCLAEFEAAELRAQRIRLIVALKGLR
jgi:S1-C subfamily serine protease